MSEPKSESEEENITTYKILERSAESALKIQRENGSFPSGENTVYNDPETPIRSTSHWLLTLSKAYEITNNKEFFNAANNAADYLIECEHRPSDHTFVARKSKKKDECNGLIGQAAPIKALTISGEILSREELISVAKDVFQVHPFDKKIALWKRIEVDGTNLSFDRTFNHQATFAARSAPLAKYSDEIDKKIRSFVTKMPENIDVYQSGLIKHYVRPPLSHVISTSITPPRYWELFWNEMTFYYYLLSEERKYKETGYHPMNLGALGLLRLQYPNNSAWDSETIRSAIEYIKTNEFKSISKNQESLYSNMNPGKGIALALYAFNQDTNLARQWLSYDIYNSYNFKSDLYELNTSDPVFQSATISSLIDIPNVELTPKYHI